MRSSGRRDLLAPLRQRFGGAVVLVLAFAAALPLVTARIYASDEVQYYAYLRSLWFDRDVSFENEYQHFYDSGVTRTPLFHETFLERSSEVTGLRVSFATMGSAILWSPFYALADAGVRLHRAMGGARYEADGYSYPYVAAVAYGSAFYAWLAVVIGWWMVRRIIGPRDALAAALAVWLGTPLFFYMYIAPPMSHACSAFAVAAFLAVWLRVRTRWTVGGCVALGALAALMGMVREQDVFIAVGPAIDFLRSQAFGLRPSALGEPKPSRAGVIRAALAGVAAFVIAYAPQLWAYTVLNGAPRPSPLVGRKMVWYSPYALGVVGSPEHGLLVWTPLVALSLAGLVWMAWRGPAAAGDDARPPARDAGWIAACLLVSVISQIYVAGSVASWTVAGAFGQRRFVGLTAVFAVGLAMLWTRARPGLARGVMAGVVALGVWWNLGLTAQFGTGLMDRQRLEPAKNAWHTFVTIPAQLPDLAYRYVFARSSFYRSSAPPRSEP